MRQFLTLASPSGLGVECWMPALMVYSHKLVDPIALLKGIPSGKRLHNYGKSPILMGISTISIAIFNSYVSLPEGKDVIFPMRRTFVCSQ